MYIYCTPHSSLDLVIKGAFLCLILLALEDSIGITCQKTGIGEILSELKMTLGLSKKDWGYVHENSKSNEGVGLMNSSNLQS